MRDEKLLQNLKNRPPGFYIVELCPNCENKSDDEEILVGVVDGVCPVCGNDGYIKWEEAN
jgi:hypothetical protein